MYAILQSATDPIVQIDSKGIIHFVNDACCKIFSYSKTEMIGKNVKMIMPETHSLNHDKYLENYLRTKEKKVMGSGRKLQGKKSNGELFPLFLSLSEFKDDDNNIYFTGILRDLSAEEKEKQKMIAIIESACDPIVQIDSKGIMQQVNNSCCKIFGYKKSELIGQNVSMLMPEPHRSNHDKYLSRYAETKEKKVIGTGRKLRAQKRDGSTFPIFLSLSEYNDGGDNFFTGIVHDLSKEEQERDRMEAMIASAVDPIVMIDSNGIICMVNPACCNVFGYKEEDMKGHNVNMLIPEPHASHHDSYLKNYLKTGVKKVLGKGRKLRGKRCDGSTFSMFLSLSEAQIGNTIYFTGIIRNLSAEEEEHETLELLINSIVDPIVVIDSTGVMLRVNPACRSVFGYDESDMLGRNVTMLMPHKHAVMHHKYLENYLSSASGSDSRIVGNGRDIEGKHKDGTMIPLFLSVSQCVLKSKNKQIFIGVMRDMTEKKKAIMAVIEKEKSDALLMNMLPMAISDRLKELDHDVHIADHFESVTILFADVVGFTEFSSNRSPMEVVTFLNTIFQSFDCLVDKYNLEKIKTIGDAYMVVSGLNMENDHTLQMLHFALDMMDEVDKFNNKQDENSHKLGIRIGINMGSVVAGVVGSKKRFFDLWGDAVNISSRMESTGISDCIQCTEPVASIAKRFPETFVVVSRGFIDVKGKGEIETFIIGKKGMESHIDTYLHHHSVQEYKKKIDLHKKISSQLNLADVDDLLKRKRLFFAVVIAVFSIAGYFIGQSDIYYLPKV